MFAIQEDELEEVMHAMTVEILRGGSMRFGRWGINRWGLGRVDDCPS